MKLRSIETTPSPNCMKLNLDEAASARPLTLMLGETALGAPAIFQALLTIEGIQSVFVINDFVTLTRKGSADWQPILAAAGRLLGLSEDADAALGDRLQADIPQAEKAAQNAGSQNFGQVEVAIQKFRGIPVQVRVTDDTQQARVALPERFNQALQNAIVATGADYVAERIWAPYQPQFGEVEAIARQVAEELDSLIDAPELAHLEQQAITSKSKAVSSQRSQTELLTDLKQPDWKQRLKAIQKIELDGETFPAVVAALQDDRATVRRWAAALLGASEQAEALSPLRQMLLTDPSPIVRRTAGDALSDLGNPQAIAAMVAALRDVSSLVRWRAARFLNELGDASAIEPLMQAAEAESEFDVRVEMTAAIDRIQAGKASQLPMWMRISNAS
ncbi:virulence factor [Leptolyngbya sp. BC1307]|uniref:virulence factor n=1 Tax=Leptolyngbya sp. BC1307 TaxID=2029589 RepID=UPI000EFACF99|nr:virulence factor [Leptolyngbya sp. BC1307]